MSKLLTVSIIIPFYGKSELQLLKCLRSLGNQTYLKSKVEILIIDNNENPILKERLKNFQQVTILHENRIGSYAARNKGIQVATGDILAFTDCDCIFDCDWIKNAVIALQNHNLKSAIGGNIIFTFQNTKKPNLFELYDSIIHLRQEYYIKNYGFAATANLIVPKDLFYKCGKFDTTFYSGGDREWGERATKSGFKIFFEKDVIVYHAARSTAFSIVNKNLRTVGGEFVRFKNNGLSCFSLLVMEKNAIKVRRNIIANGIGVNNKISLFKIMILFYVVQSFRILEVFKLCLGCKPQRQ